MGPERPRRGSQREGKPLNERDKELFLQYLQLREHNISAADHAFTSLYIRIEPQLRRFVHAFIAQRRQEPHLVDDIIQRIFLVLLEKTDVVIEKENMIAWLTNVAKNVSLQMIGAQREKYIEDVFYTPVPDPQPAETLSVEAEPEKATDEVTRRAIAAIPDTRVRQATYLVHIRRQEHHKINRRLRTNPTSLKQLVAMGELFVRESIETKEEIEKNGRHRIEILKHIKETYPHRFHAAIHQVPGDRQRQMLVDIYEQQKSPQDIMLSTGLKRNTVDDTIRNARDILQNLLLLQPSYRSGELAGIDQAKEQAPDLFEHALEQIRSPQQKQALQLFEREGYTYQQIANTMQIELTQVRDFLYKGRKQLLLLLQGAEVRMHDQPLQRLRAFFQEQPVEATQRIQQQLSQRASQAILLLLEGNDRAYIAEKMGLTSQQVNDAIQDAVKKMNLLLPT